MSTCSTVLASSSALELGGAVMGSFQSNPAHPGESRGPRRKEGVERENFLQHRSATGPPIAAPSWTSCLGPRLRRDERVLGGSLALTPLPATGARQLDDVGRLGAGRRQCTGREAE